MPRSAMFVWWMRLRLRFAADVGLGGGCALSVRGLVWSGAALLTVVGLAACGGSTTTTTTTTVAPAKAVQVVITAPANGAVVKADNVTIRGTVTPTNATVQVDGQAAPVGNGVFTASVKLSPGGRRSM